MMKSFPALPFQTFIKIILDAARRPFSVSELHNERASELRHTDEASAFNQAEIIDDKLPDFHVSSRLLLINHV